MLLLENMLLTAEIWWNYDVLFSDLVEMNSVVGPNFRKNIAVGQSAAFLAITKLLNR